MLAFLVVAALPVAGHIGSPNVFYEGQAGPWPVRITVRAPLVVPGTAEISVRVHEPGAEVVRIRMARFDSDLDDASTTQGVRGGPGDGSLWNAEHLFTASGSYRLVVEVEGAAGSGATVVPVQVSAARRPEIHPHAKVLFIALGLLLTAGVLSLLRTVVRAALEPGTEVDAGLVRGSLVTVIVALASLVAVVFGGRSWWAEVDDLGDPFTVSAATRSTTGPRVLDIYLDDERFEEAGALVPDHGKLMHMFLIREPALDAFAHVHPVRVEDRAFAVAVPSSLPAGTYRIYADLAHDTGLARTVTTTVNLGEEPSEQGPSQPFPTPDIDDSWSVAGAPEGKVHGFEDGYSLIWDLGTALRVGEETVLRFRLRDENGAPAALEPYMGMLGHAAVRRHDGAVFVHLHPTGTVSMASLQLSETRLPKPVAGTMDPGAADPGAADPGAADHAAMGHAAMGHAAMGHAAMGHAAMGHAAMGHAAIEDSVEFPYELPRSGTYRLWVQVKSAGRVYTGVFDERVDEAR